MNLAKYSLDNTKIIYLFLAVLLIGGISSFGKLGNKEDAPFVKMCIRDRVNVGDTVKKGQTSIILEAMKMENNINADKDGKITRCV